MLGSVNEAKITLIKEMSQVLGDQEFPVAAKIKKLAYGPVRGKLGVAPSALMPELVTEVSQATRDWPSYQPASEAVYTMPRATPSILKKRRLGQPINDLPPEPKGIWERLKNSIEEDWLLWLAGAVLFAGLLAIIATPASKK